MRTLTLVAALALTAPFLVSALATAPLPALESAEALGGGARVTVKSYAFVDSQTGQGVSHIRVGETVTWTFQSFHSATHGAHAGVDGIAGGDFNYRPYYKMVDGKMVYVYVFTHTFTEPGVFEYYCDLGGPHAGMRGVVVVTA